jgi:hypothetical protein
MHFVISEMKFVKQVLFKYPDFSQPFDIYTDNSSFQLGSVISQNDWPIAFYSRKLTLAQQNYTTMEKELLLVVETAQQYQHILLGHRCRFFAITRTLVLTTFNLNASVVGA